MNPGDGSLSGRQPKAVASALQVLEEVARAGPGVTAKEIAAALSGRVDQRAALQRQLEKLRECARRLAPLLA